MGGACDPSGATCRVAAAGRAVLLLGPNESAPLQRALFLAAAARLACRVVRLCAWSAEVGRGVRADPPGTLNTCQLRTDYADSQTTTFIVLTIPSHRGSAITVFFGEGMTL